MKIDNYAPICLFVFKRLSHTKATVETLQKNFLANKSCLYIFSDAGRNEREIKQVNEVREYLTTITGFKDIQIFKASENNGLAGSIISGVSKILDIHHQAIILEDDLLTTPNFLDYMNQCLSFYKSNPKVLSISGYAPKITPPDNYSFDNAFNIRASSWGWATWKDRWDQVDWECAHFSDLMKSRKAIRNFNKGGSDLTSMLKRQMAGQISSWAIRFCFHQFINDQFDVIPIASLVFNNGFGDDASHCDIKYESPILDVGEKRYFNLSTNPELIPIIHRQTVKPYTISTRLIRVFKRIAARHFSILARKHS